MRIRIILAAPLLNIMQIYMGEPLHVEYRLHAQEMSGGSLTSLYYQLKYDTSFWSSTDEASGKLRIDNRFFDIINWFSFVFAKDHWSSMIIRH